MITPQVKQAINTESAVTLNANVGPLLPDLISAAKDFCRDCSRLLLRAARLGGACMRIIASARRVARSSAQEPGRVETELAWPERKWLQVLRAAVALRLEQGKPSTGVRISALLVTLRELEECRAHAMSQLVPGCPHGHVPGASALVWRHQVPSWDAQGAEFADAERAP